MSVIPCLQNDDLQKQIERYAEILKTEAHRLGDHGLDENEFYNSGLFRGAIERVRGQFSATMKPKRDFVRDVLNFMQDQKAIADWEPAGENNRHDYTVRLPSGRVAAIELKGCMDGNNTNIFDRPAHAQEFVIWSVCTNPGADPRKNAWSGVHTRLSADIISREQRVDGLIVWDMVCGTVARRCPKLKDSPNRATVVAQFKLPPPCLYVLPATIASPRSNPAPVAQLLADVQLLQAFHDCFGGRDDEVNYVDFEIEHNGAETQRKTKVRRGGGVVRESAFTPIQRK